MQVLALCSTPLWIYMLFWIFGSQGMLLVPVAVIAHGVFSPLSAGHAGRRAAAADQAANAVPA